MTTVFDQSDSAGPPMVLGVLGGVGAGKSTVAELLGEHGAEVIDADRIGHQVLEQPEVRAALADEFGPAVLDERGKVDRGALAEVAFSEPQRVQALNDIVHPPIIEEVRARIERIRRTDGAPLIVLDAALLVESDLHREMCDALLHVEAPLQLRRERAVQRGMTHAQFEKRSRAQMPPEAKRRLADYVVRNDGSRRDLKRQIEELWPELCPGTNRH